MGHTLDFPEGKARDSVYGTALTYPNYDGYHLRADKDRPGKNRAMTKSLLNALKSAGLNRKGPYTDSVTPTKVEEESIEHGKIEPVVVTGYADSVKIKPVKELPPQYIVKEPKVVESKIPRRQKITNLVSKSIKKKSKGVKEITADEDWPNEISTKKLLPKVLPTCGVTIKNKFQPDVVEQFVNTVTKTPTKNPKKYTVQKKTEKN